ncbi:MAG: TIGR02594 family protein [Afipia sp.]|nr:TIGR02594 family protein [Afipia sp.]
MTLSRKLRLPLRGAALALCSVAIVALATPASARPHHGASRHYHAHLSKHHAKKHYRHHARRGRYAAAAATAEASTSQGFGGFGGSNIVAEARRYIGSGNPTGRSGLWCARFMNMVLERSGHKGTGSDMARSFAGYGQRISGPQVGAIAVMSRGRRGGHVGIVSGIDPKGNPIVISGNHGHRVAEATYSRGRVYAYVMPSS